MASAYPKYKLEQTTVTDNRPTDDAFVMPTSLAQQRFWLLDQLEPGNTALNMPLALRLTGKLDTVVLQRTFNEIVSRHEILRTTFSTENGKPAQVIAMEQTVQMDVVDLSNLPDTDSEAKTLMVEEAHITFDLARGPLFKIKLLRLSAEEHILLLTLHHIICDGWSNGVLVREIGGIYSAFSNGRPSPFDDLPIQYADFAAWQNEWLRSEGCAEQLSYWKQQLGNELPVLDIPTDFPRARNRTSFGEIESLLLPHAFTRAIKALGHREDVTPFMIFLAAFNVLLHRYCGQDHILIGSPTANRTQSETEGLIGAFANTLLLKSDLSGNPTFNEILRRVKDISLGAFSNQSAPLEKLVETIRPTQRRNNGQLFQVLFIFQTAFMQPTELEDLTITPIRSVSPGSIFELSLGIVERLEGTRLQMEYNTELFKADTIRNVLNDLKSILHSAVLDSQTRISDVLQWTTPLGSRQEETSSSPIGDVDRRIIKARTVTGNIDGIEDTLQDIWKHVLHLDSVSIHDDFFEVGGHSLLAAQLFDEIAKRFSVNLPLATLFKANTIDELSKLIREAKPRDKWTSLVQISTEGTRPPLFLMHAAGGNVLFYKDLANRLGADQPVYGMQAVGLDGHQSAYDRIEDMAAHYIEEIKGVQPKGPYRVGGSSLGGLIAFEVASQLSRSGEDVQLVVLIDTHAPGYPKFLPGTSRRSLKYLRLIDRVEHHIDTLLALEPGRRWSYVNAKAIKGKNQMRRVYKQTKKKIERGLLTRLGRPLPDALVVTQNAIASASKVYNPPIYDGDLVLFRASKQIRGIVRDDSLGWSEFATGRLEIHEVKGSHGSIVVEPRVRFVASLLDELLGSSTKLNRISTGD